MAAIAAASLMTPLVPVHAQGDNRAKIVFTKEFNGNGDIFSMALDLDAPARSTPKRITKTPDLDEYGAVWSPDGARIAFAVPARASTSLFLIDADGTGRRRLTRAPHAHYDGDPVWSPDGQLIAFTRTSDQDPSLPSLRVIDVLSREEIDLGRGRDPDWTQDGTQILFAGGDFKRRYHLYIGPSDGQGTYPYTELTTGNSSEESPSFSPDQSRVAYHASVNQGFEDVFVMNADGTGQTQLTFTPEESDVYPIWSPDGTYLAFEREEIWIMDPNNGTGQRVLTPGFCPSWAPDGSALSVCRYEGSGGALYFVPLDGSPELRLAGARGRIWSADWVAI